MDAEQLTAKLNAHAKWLKNESDESAKRFLGDGVDFIRGNWSNHPLSCAILFDSRFDDCDLSDVDFFQAELRGSTFHRAKMVGVTLTKANLDGCVFDEASMDRISARKLGVCDTSFVATSLVGADLRFSTFIRGDFSRATLIGANIEGCTFDRCKLCDSVLTGVIGLESVNLESTILVGLANSPVELRGPAAVEWMRGHSIR